MGFYPIETIKQDARLRFGVNFLNPCVNHSDVACAPKDGDVRIGLRFIKNVGTALSDAIICERERHGPYIGASDFARRTDPKQNDLISLVSAGALDDDGVVKRGAVGGETAVRAQARSADVHAGVDTGQRTGATRFHAV